MVEEVDLSVRPGPTAIYYLFINYPRTASPGTASPPPLLGPCRSRTLRVMASPCFPRPPARSASGPNPGAPSGPLGAPRGPFGAFWGDPGLSTRGLAFVTCLALSKLLGRSRASSGDLEGFRVILKRRNRLGAETLISQKRMAWRLLDSRGEFLERIIVLGLG